MDALRIICLSICYLVSSTLAADEVVNDIYTKAASCPYRFNMGCFLDVVEKCCTGLQAVEGCINKKGKAKCDVRELGRLVGALDPKNIEALNKCCCTKAFADGYEDCKSPNPVCKKAIADHVEKDVKIHLPILKKCLKKPTKANCKPAIDSIKWASAAVQKARGDLRPTEGCSILAPSEPISDCGWDLKPKERAIKREDLYCDTIIWQFKEMGASDPFMSQCKDAPKMPESTGQEGEGEEPNEEGQEEPDEEESDGQERDGQEPDGQESDGQEEDSDGQEEEGANREDEPNKKKKDRKEEL